MASRGASACSVSTLAPRTEGFDGRIRLELSLFHLPATSLPWLTRKTMANAFVSRLMTAIALAAWLCLTARSASAIQPHSSDYATQVGKKWLRCSLCETSLTILSLLSRLGLFLRLEHPKYRIANPDHRYMWYSAAALFPSLTVDLHSSM